MKSPDVPFLILWAAMIAAGFFAASPYLDFPWYLIAFVSVNLATFLLFCLDKRLAALESRRIPERTLHLTAFRQARSSPCTFFDTRLVRPHFSLCLRCWS